MASTRPSRTSAGTVGAHAKDAGPAQLRQALAAARRENAELLVENGRLRAEQAATGEVLRLITASRSDAWPVLGAIVERAVRFCGAPDAVLFVVRGGQRVGWAHHGTLGTGADLLGPGVVSTATATGATQFGPAQGGVSRASVAGRAYLDRSTVHVPDVAAASDAEFGGSKIRARREGVRALLSTPLLFEGEAIGMLTLRRGTPGPFSPGQVALLESLAAQAAIAIENARLFFELQQRLEEQTATARVLEAISRSPTDVRRVLDEIAKDAARLCRSENALLYRLDEDGLRVTAAHGPLGQLRLQDGGARPPTRDFVTGRAVLDRQTVRVADMHGPDGEDFPAGQSAALRYGGRAMMAAPLLRDGAAIGAIQVVRAEPSPYDEQQVKLLQTFADQAVIAIENARLFSELNESNTTLKEALEQQTATAEVLRVIASSPADLEAVLGVICSGAARLCDTDDVQLFRAIAGKRVLAAHYGHELTRSPIGQSVPLQRGYASTEAILTGAVFHSPDVTADERLRVSTYGATDYPVRTLLAVPLLRDGIGIGAINLRQAEVRPFSNREIELVKTFADQAVIAIENSRLFEELRLRDERRRQELERAAYIQRRLLPSVVQGWPGILEIAVRFRPAVETSGDFYDVLALPPVRQDALPPLQVAVGDVAGKGMSAALVTALARSALRATASVPTQLATPAGTLRLAGQRLHEDVGGSHFVACALALVEPPGPHHTGPRLRLTNAAQVPVLLVRDRQPRELEPPGYRLPLGAQLDGDYTDLQVDLRPGDVVVFSSDGLVEAPALPTTAAPAHLPPSERPGELFGFSRLAASAAHWAARAPVAESVAEGIWADLTAWCGSESHHDDMTLLVLRVPEAAP